MSYNGVGRKHSLLEHIIENLVQVSAQSMPGDQVLPQEKLAF